MKKDPQGKRWHRLDNTGKIFPMIANENLSNVFRISVILKHDIVPNLLQQALEDTLPMFKGFKVKLKRGFFWYYFEGNKRTPYIEKETSWPVSYTHLEFRRFHGVWPDQARQSALEWV